MINFYINQNDIIAKYCVNKTKPELKCNGNCHLTKQLSKQLQKSPNNKNRPLSLLIYLPDTYFTTPLIKINHTELIIKKNNHHYLNQYYFLNVIDILKPPQV